MREQKRLPMLALLASLLSGVPTALGVLGRNIEPQRHQHARGATATDAARIGAAEAKRARRIARNRKLEADK